MISDDEILGGYMGEVIREIIMFDINFRLLFIDRKQYN